MGRLGDLFRGVRFPGHPYMEEDKQNFTLVIENLRDGLGVDYEIGFAAGGFKRFFDESAEWDKVMPITIVAPIPASSPLWTLVGALIIFGERLTPLQWLGITVTIVSYYLFSLAGQREGINFQKNKWVLFIFLATIAGAGSGLYDKFLISNIERMSVQAWFSIYLIPVLLLPTVIVWYQNRNKNIPFFWKPAIPLIGVALTLSDYSYFYALSFEDSLISILAVLRRSSVLISFAAGAFLFREINLTRKSLVLAGILIGVFFIILGS